MSGHSKWSTIKRRKGVEDAKRGKIFTKLIREITVAARVGGGDVNANPRLRHVLQTARSQNMPSTNVDRAIKRGTGELSGESYEEVLYEGYGPGGVAVLVESLTDNKNRTVSEIRNIFSRNSGNLGANGCVSWMFERKGILIFDKDKVAEDKLFEFALENGAEDVSDRGNTFEIKLQPTDFLRVKEAADQAGLKYTLAELTMVPQSTVSLQGKAAEQMLRLMENLEDSDDVQKVYANFDIDEKEMERIAGN